MKNNGIRRLLSALLIVILLFCCGCGGAQKPLVVERDAPPDALLTANAAAALALRQYIYARLMTEAFLSTDLKALSMAELEQTVDALTAAWQTAAELASGAETFAARAVAVLMASASNGAVRSAAARAGLSAPCGAPYLRGAVLADTSGGSAADTMAWAEELTRQYDAIKGGKAVQQLAGQLGVDAKSAYDQLVLAQEIIRSQAVADADFWDKMTKAAQATKTVCKVGVYVSATVVTGGGSLAALAGSSMSLGVSGAVIVGGVDCIVDVATTGSTIVLGENHQVTADFESLKNQLAPISMVVGLATFNAAETGEQLAYIGDSLVDWYYGGKILGIEVSPKKSGAVKVSAQSIDVAGQTPKQLASTVKKAGFSLPETKARTPQELAEDFAVSEKEIKSELEALAQQMYAAEQSAGAQGVAQASADAAPGQSQSASAATPGAQNTPAAQQVPAYADGEVVITVRNVSGTSCVLDGDRVGFYDDTDALDAEDFLVASGGSVDEWIDAEEQREAGYLVETSSTTYTLVAAFIAGPLPDDPEEDYLYIEDAVIMNLTLYGTYGVNPIVEWNGATFTQVE